MPLVKPPLSLERPAAVAHLEGLGAGLGGRIRAFAEDFLVEEIPLRRPSGRGNFAYIEIEKCGSPTLDVLLFLSKKVKVSERKIGYAGLKDARAIARQYLTLPKVDPERLLRVRHPKFRVVSATHTEKPLKIGHHKGNRFEIRIRDCDASRVGEARRVLDRLVARGLPNAFGGQRFGTRQDGHLLGRSVVRCEWQELMDQMLGRPNPIEGNPLVVDARRMYDRGELDGARQRFPKKHRAEKRALSVLTRGGTPRDAFEAVTPAQRRIWVSAWQSYHFNAVLDRRVRDDTYDCILPGDLAWLHASGAFFTARDTDTDRELAKSGRASATGPLLGYDMRQPGGPSGALEQQLAAELGMAPEELAQAHCRARGGRRPLRIPLSEATIRAEDETTVVVRFVLPPGAFATVVLEHLMEG